MGSGISISESKDYKILQEKFENAINNNKYIIHYETDRKVDGELNKLSDEWEQLGYILYWKHKWIEVPFMQRYNFSSPTFHSYGKYRIGYSIGIIRQDDEVEDVKMLVDNTI